MNARYLVLPLWLAVLAGVTLGCGKSGIGNTAPDARDATAVERQDAMTTVVLDAGVPDAADGPAIDRRDGATPDAAEAARADTGDLAALDAGRDGAPPVRDASLGDAGGGRSDAAAIDMATSDGGTSLDGPSLRERFADPTQYLAIKQQLRFQISVPPNAYDLSSDNIKSAWVDWSDRRGTIPNKPDFHDALDEAAAWLSAPDRFENLQQPGTALTPEGGGGETEDRDTATPYYYVPLAHAWKVFVWWTAHNVALEMTGALPWSLAGDSEDQLAPLFDSTEMMHRRSGDFLLGGAPHGNYVGTPYASYPGATIIGAPRYTYRFLAQQGMLKSTRRATITALLDWVSANLIHFEGYAHRDICQDHWGHRYDPSVEMLIEGTTRASDGKFAHWTLGCHGTTRFIKDVLRAANIPVRLAFNCEHAQVLFVSEDAYMTHGDHPYNSAFKASGCSTDWLLVDRTRWESLFGPGQVNHKDATLCDATPNPVAYSSLPEILATCK